MNELFTLIALLVEAKWQLRHADGEWLEWFSADGSLSIDVFAFVGKRPNAVAMRMGPFDDGSAPVDHVTFDGSIGECIEYVRRGCPVGE